MTPITEPEGEDVSEATPRPWMFTGDIETVFRTVATDPYRDGNLSNEQWPIDAALIVEAVNAYDHLRAIEAAARDVKAEHEANGHREPCELCAALDRTP